MADDEPADDGAKLDGRPYFRRLGTEQRQAVIEHGADRFPLVDVYECLPIAFRASGGTAAVKFFLYYGHEERDLLVAPRVPRPLIGTKFSRLLDTYGVDWTDESSVGDVVNDFLDAFFIAPWADEMEHRTSDWIDRHRDQTVAALRQRDEWDDLRWLVRPSRLLVGGPVTAGSTTITPYVNVEHISHGALVLTAAADLGLDGTTPRQSIDVMAVLRG